MADLVFNNPLTQQHLNDINTALQAINIAREQIAMAKRAGIDVSAHETAVGDTEKRLLAIKQVYFPGQ